MTATKIHYELAKMYKGDIIILDNTVSTTDIKNKLVD